MATSTMCDIESPLTGRRTPEFEHAKEAIAFLISESSRLCTVAAKDRARAIVLTGSMSRGESTVKREDAGWRVLGDATFMLVSERPLDLCIAKLECDIERFLLMHGIKCRVVVVTSTVSDLKNMKPQIYAFELRERGIVVWGDEAVLENMPHFSVAQIPREDGWWLLCNRMIEQLETAVSTDKIAQDSAAVRYRIAKLYLAMAACYLLVRGEYAPSYRERARHLSELLKLKVPPISPIPLDRFAALVSECTYLKLEGNTSGASTKFPEWQDAVLDAEAMWRWALGQILSTDPHCSRADLLAKLASRQPLNGRLKGWLRAGYVKRSALRRNWRRWARLATIASPRYLVYGAASEMFFSSLDSDAASPSNLAPIRASLPLVDEDNARLSWNGLVKTIANDFHSLLESNRS